MFTDYDRFASVYNKYWGNEFTPRLFPILESLVLRQLPGEASILDLCCGTGQLARTLTGLGYRVTGIDGSDEMLRHARENAPRAEFFQADARDFSLPSTFDAVISVFDSLNHVMTLEELTAVFRNVHTALAPGGPFLFDLNMAAGFSIVWNDNFGIVEDDMVCVVRTSYDPDAKTARFDATIFNSPDGWQRVDLSLLQRCYEESEIRSALEAAGFGGITGHAHDERRGLVELDDSADRAFFLCHRPA
jgi:SAM-dependent methyltransferase